MNKTTRHAAGTGRSLRLGIVPKTAAFIPQLRRDIRRIRPDIVHTNSLKADLLGGIAARLAGVKLVWHIHDRIAEDYLPAKMVWLLRNLCRRLPHAVIANSQATLNTLRLPPCKKAIIAYPGLPDPHPGQSPSTLAATTAEPPAESGGKVIMVGRISPWKGQDVFIRAAAIVHKSRPNARFEIVGSVLFGEDAYESEIRQLVQSLGLQDIVSFLGFRKDIPELIAASDLLVHASTTPEPFGQVVVQAMAAGKPVVATRGGGVMETVAEYETGFLVPMGNAPAMATAISTILANPAQAAAMGIAGRQRFLEHFTIQKTVDQIQKLYESMGPR